MMRTIIALSLLLAVGLSTGCNRAKDEVLPNGIKLFGARTLKDGTKTIVRDEWPNGQKDFDVTVFPDHTVKVARCEHPNGAKGFDVTALPDGTVKTVREENADGSKNFDVTQLTDGSFKDGRVEFPSGEKRFDVTVLPDHTAKIGRLEDPNGEKWFDVTGFPDGTFKVGRLERPDGTKQFNVDYPSADHSYGLGMYLRAAGNLSGAKEAFETVLTKFPASNLVDQSKQRLEDVNTAIARQEEAKLAEEREKGEPIEYVDFYAKSHTGLVIGKRYRFQADINHIICLQDGRHSNGHVLCGVRAAFDNDAEYEAFLRGPEELMATIVASMRRDGYVQIHKVRAIPN